MNSIDSAENQNISVELATSNIDNVKSSVRRIIADFNPQLNDIILDKWIPGDNNFHKEIPVTNSRKKVQCSEHYEMPRRLNWDVFRKIYDIQPKNYEELVSIPGFGPAAVRALSLIVEIIFGTKASWQDPVKYNFAHCGKDGVPYPVACKTYDNSIGYLSSAIEGAEIQRQDRVQALKKLADYSARTFDS